ncbi:MAG: twin-arginine translocase subunit TatC [Candidatus Bathyarchaeia archaeon]
MTEETKTVWEHTEELISRLRVALICFIIASVIVAMIPASWFSLEIPPPRHNITATPQSSSVLAKFFYGTVVMYVFHRLGNDLLPPGLTLFASGFTDVIWIYFLIAFMLGFIISSPVTFYEIYKFINPAFTRGERRLVLYSFSGFAALFTLGAFLAYYFIIPITLRVLMGFAYATAVAPWFTIRAFLELVIFMIIGSGLSFTFPIFTSLAVRAGMLESRRLVERRRVAIVGILILTAILTPDPTPISMLILSVPMIVLYEVSIWAARRIERGEGGKEKPTE